MFNKKQKSKILAISPMLGQNKATVGETVTWIVATVIIIVVLIFSVIISGIYLGKNKNLEIKGVDILTSKSFYSYLLTEDESGEIVYNQLKDEGNLNDFNGALGKEILQKFYDVEYSSVWVGILTEGFPLSLSTNIYFGARPSNIILLSGPDVPKDFIFNRIKLDENKTVELVLGTNKPLPI